YIKSESPPESPAFAGNHTEIQKFQKNQRTSPPQTRTDIASGRAASEHRRVRLGGRDPNTKKYRDQTHDKVRGDWLVDQPSGEQPGANGFYRHVIRPARRRGSPEREPQKNESQPPPADSEVSTGNPLQGAKTAQDRDSIGGKASQDK